MNKVVKLGAVKGFDRLGRNHPSTVYCRIQHKDGRLSISGVEGPLSNGNAIGGCGQIVMSLLGRPEEFVDYAEGWDAESVDRFLHVWDEWHLNDMRAGCKHQRADWNLAAPIELIHYTWTTAYHDKRKLAESGQMDPTEYAQWGAIVALVHRATIGLNSPKFPAGCVQDAMALGYIKEQKREPKAACWVHHLEHPKGLLMKPCGICGYRYGSQWRKEEVPQEILAYLEGLPESDTTPAWC